MPPFGPPSSSRQNVQQSFAEGARRAMAATRAQPCTREIFTTLEYGPVPESHACALVRACLAATVYSLNPLGRFGRAGSRHPLRRSRKLRPLGARDSRYGLEGWPGRPASRGDGGPERRCSVSSGPFRDGCSLNPHSSRGPRETSPCWTVVPCAPGTLEAHGNVQNPKFFQNCFNSLTVLCDPPPL